MADLPFPAAASPARSNHDIAAVFLDPTASDDDIVDGENSLHKAGTSIQSGNCSVLST